MGDRRGGVCGGWAAHHDAGNGCGEFAEARQAGIARGAVAKRVAAAARGGGRHGGH